MTWKKGTSRDHPNYSIAQIGQNTKKIPGDLGRLVLTQTGIDAPSSILPRLSRTLDQKSSFRSASANGKTAGVRVLNVKEPSWKKLTFL